jgi:UDP-GlcNAc:undecaprenyl-phosphate/decaprenyl-phosphate GlcNAc-1-phosphate transferase
VAQATLFLAAYFLRFESDVTILIFVSVFFVLSIFVMQLAARSGWQLRAASPAADSPLSRIVTVIQQPKLLPRLSYMALALALTVYACLVVLGTVALSNDIRLLIIALFTLTISLALIVRAGPLGVVEKAVLYVTATILVYLDAVALPAAHLMSVLTWIAVSIAALATAVRLRLYKDRRFQVTPLDLIVLFMALVVPSLPGTFNLQHGGALTIAKLLVLFYAIEVLVSRSESRAVWVRIAVVSVLAGLCVRPLMPF